MVCEIICSGSKQMKPHIIAFEGLLSFWPFGMFVRKGLLEPLSKEFDFTYSIYSWWWPWVKIPKHQMVIVCGHSFGGKRAIEFYNKNYVHIGVVVSLDPRMKPPAALSSLTGIFNFYQTGAFHGYQVSGAANTNLLCSHTAIPSARAVHDLFRKLLRGDA